MHFQASEAVREGEGEGEGEARVAAITAVSEASEVFRGHKEVFRGIVEESYADLARALDRLFALPGVEDDARRKIIRLLYWNAPDVSSDWLCDYFGLTRHDLRTEAGKLVAERTCDRCGRTSTRVATARLSAGSINNCPLCHDDRERRQREDFEAQDRRKQEAARRVEELRRMPYRDYLRSPEWQARRTYYLRQAWFRCQACNAKNTTLDVHHRTYERRGSEASADLIVLCRDCHQTFHDSKKLA